MLAVYTLKHLKSQADFYKHFRFGISASLKHAIR